MLDLIYLFFISGPNGTPFHPHVSTEGRSNTKFSSKKVVHLKNYTWEPTEIVGKFVQLFVSKWPSATARSTAAGTPVPGLPALDRDPQRHIKEERSKENSRKQWSHSIITEYGKFYLPLKREAKC